MFDVTTSKGYDAGKLNFVNKNENAFEFVGRTKENYGVQGYIGKLKTNPNSENTISVSQVGAVHAQLRLNKWYSSQNVFVLSPKYEELINLLVVTAIDKILVNYGGYSSYPTLETLKEHNITIPTKNGEIDFEFIESFVSQLEAQHIAKLEAYLKVTGLKDYELTKDEKLVLDELDNIEYKEFKLGDLFEVNTYKKRFDANKITVLENGKYPYVVRMSANNGQKGYILEDENYLNDGNTLSFGQDTATVFYQEKPYFTGDKIKILKCKLNSFFKNNALIFVTAISKAFSRFSWGSGSYSVGVISEQYIKLPTKNGEIDFEHMETLISAIQKLVIKDVILFSDKKIETTEKLIGKTNI